MLFKRPSVNLSNFFFSNRDSFSRSQDFEAPDSLSSTPLLVKPFEHAENMGVILDSDLNFQMHISKDFNIF